MCECERCAFNKLFEENLALIPEGAREFFIDLHEKYCMASQDLDQANSIIEGFWPSSDDYIAAARQARALRLEEEARLNQNRTGVVIDMFRHQRRS